MRGHEIAVGKTIPKSSWLYHESHAYTAPRAIIAFIELFRFEINGDILVG